MIATGRINAVMVTPDASTPAADLGARTRLGPLPEHRTVLYVKDIAVTLVVLLALPYLVHKLVTRPGKVLDGSVSLP